MHRVRLRRDANPLQRQPNATPRHQTANKIPDRLNNLSRYQHPSPRPPNPPKPLLAFLNHRLHSIALMLRKCSSGLFRSK